MLMLMLIVLIGRGPAKPVFLVKAGFLCFHASDNSHRHEG
jgi:hypothetical protein